MLEIIQNLLNAQLFENGKPELCKERIDLTSLVQTVLQGNRAGTQENPSHSTSSTGKRPFYYGGRNKMQRVVDNLTSNAVKFSLLGSAVDIRLNDDGERVRLTVADEGPGLTVEDKQKVFGKLERLSADPTGGEHSTGLGLFIVKTLVEQHGGSVGVNSIAGEGATFYVELPVDEDIPSSA